MQVTSVPLYYSHITTGIDKLDNRKDKYLYHRLKFLKQYCQPIQNKINKVKQQIQKTKQLQRTQDQLIQSQKDIIIMKSHIKQYQKTKGYYLMHIDHYQQKYLEIKTRNQKLRAWIKEAKQQISIASKQEYKSVQQMIKQEQEFQQSEMYSQNLEKSQVSSMLPPLINPTKHYQNIIIKKMKQQIQRSSIDLHSSKVSRKKDLSKSIIQNPQNSITIQQRITEFDQIQSLFRQCFEKKKQQVQKSVSQLQSKLIENKQIFLKACQVIGQKNDNLKQQEFLCLSCDQIITLFISFGWLNRKLNSQFNNKRKQMIEYTKRKNHRKLTKKFHH